MSNLITVSNCVLQFYEYLKLLFFTYRVVNMICSILMSENTGSVTNKKRFMEEFSGSELIMPKKKPKPEDYEQLFKGNIDDNFRIGLSLTKKSVKVSLFQFNN